MSKKEKWVALFLVVPLFTYDITSREVAYGVFSGQRDGAEHDEDQDKIGEDLMVDELMAEYTKSTAESEKQKQRMYNETNSKSALYWLLHSTSFKLTHGLVLLKMKKALPTGMGGVFSLMVSSDNR